MLPQNAFIFKQLIHILYKYYLHIQYVVLHWLEIPPFQVYPPILHVQHRFFSFWGGLLLKH